MADEDKNNTEQKGEEDTQVRKDPISLFERTAQIVKQQEEANKRTEELLDRREKLLSDEILAGTTGGNITAIPVDPKDKKVSDAKEYFKGTELENAIRKANE